MVQDYPYKTLPSADKRRKNEDELSSLLERRSRERPLIEAICHETGISDTQLFICSTQNQCLLLQTSNSVVATQVRMNANKLLDTLNQACEWPEPFRKIDIQIRPMYQKQTTRHPALKKMSKQNAQLLEETAQCIDNPKLSAILQRLAKHS